MEQADNQSTIDTLIPEAVRSKYEVRSYRSAALILSQNHKDEFSDLVEALKSFELTTAMIRKPGGNESEVPKAFSSLLRPKGWYETSITGDLLVRVRWKEQIGVRANGKPYFERKEIKSQRKQFLDGHKIDYVKGKVAFDLEWNSKDQTFDRDLYAFRTFAETGVIDVAVLLTRSSDLNPIFESMGAIVDSEGKTVLNKKNKPQLVKDKYGASTTWMGKLTYRLNAGRHGACPVLALGIKPECIADPENI